MDKSQLQKNITKLNSISFFKMFLVLMPIIVPFFESFGRGMRGVYELQAIFAVTVFVCEIPSGYFSDILGRKQTLVFAFALKAIGFSLFPFANDFWILVVAEVILGIAVSLTSGSDTALLYDTLDALESKKTPIKILGRYVSYMPLGEGIAAVLATLLMFLGTSLSSIVIITALMSWIPFFISMSLIEPPRQKMEQKHSENLKYIATKLFKQTKLLRLIIYNSIFSFNGTLVAVWLFQKYWSLIDIPLSWFGVLWAITNFVVAYSHRKAHKVEKFLGSSTLIIFLGLIPVAGYLGIAYINNFFGFFICLLFNLGRGFGQIVYKDALNKRVTSDFRASANSVIQMGVRIVFVILGPLLGWLLDHFSLKVAGQALSVFYILIFLILVLPLVGQRTYFDKIKLS